MYLVPKDLTCTKSVCKTKRLMRFSPSKPKSILLRCSGQGINGVQGRAESSNGPVDG
jgi:hypothetical protein